MGLTQVGLLGKRLVASRGGSGDVAGGGTLSGGQVIAAPPWGGVGPTQHSRQPRPTLNLTLMGTFVVARGGLPLSPGDPSRHQVTFTGNGSA